jgi:hypothetical protein
MLAGILKEFGFKKRLKRSGPSSLTKAVLWKQPASKQSIYPCFCKQ